ncbi:hypothetical protein TanjilG_09513 [Lupinus angustifolius]|uniref:Uncharacterized protein n=1 Tax=Lupinus angustifolius TaxID=3871 RepID=A0A1J7GQN9_LUPAN|nr:hypothetical protein TanjilG_09513 [Lupinus angustifolius]
MEIVVDDNSPGQVEHVSYKDKLLNLPEDNEESPMLDGEEDMVENRWYQEVDEEREFDPCSEISISKEEFELWCKPWKQALVVKLLG